MSDLLDRVRAEIRDRLELARSAVAEYEQLEAALVALGANAEVAAAPAGRVRRPRAGRGSGRPGQPARKRAPRGANRAALLRAVGERPGASAGELARASGLAKPTVYALLRSLTERAEIVRRELPGGGTGFAPAAADATPSPGAVLPAPAAA